LGGFCKNSSIRTGVQKKISGTLNIVPLSAFLSKD